MRVKRFVGDSVAETVSKIKQDFGQEAIILQTRQFKEGGFLGLFGQTKVEITAALDDQEITGYGDAPEYETGLAGHTPVWKEMGEQGGDAIGQKIEDSVPEDDNFLEEAPPAYHNLENVKTVNKGLKSWGITEDDQSFGAYLLDAECQAVGEQANAGRRGQWVGHTKKGDPMGAIVQTDKVGMRGAVDLPNIFEDVEGSTASGGMRGTIAQGDARGYKATKTNTAVPESPAGKPRIGKKSPADKKSPAGKTSPADKKSPSSRTKIGKGSSEAGQVDAVEQAASAARTDKANTSHAAGHLAQEPVSWSGADSSTDKLLRSIAQARMQNALEEAARMLVDDQKKAVKSAVRRGAAGVEGVKRGTEAKGLTEAAKADPSEVIKRVPGGDSMAELATMEENMKEIKILINEIHHYLNAESGGVGFVPEPLQKWREYLCRRGVSDTLCREMMFEVQIALQENQWQDDRKVFTVLKNNILAKCSQTQTLKIQDLKEEGRPLVIALVGPTGVGKTTTIGKLSAGFSIVDSRKVGLVTADTYRVAAVEQLRTFGEILGIPVDVVMGASGLTEAIAQHKDKDIILIDTAGRSPNHVMHMGELEELMNAAQPDLTLLVISATTHPEEQSLVLEKFRPLSTHMILTKLDESRYEGAVLDLVTRADLPLSYLTNGQNVPDDIEVATPEKLMGWILGQGAKGEVS